MPKINMLTVLSATCDNDLEDFLRDEIPNVNLLGSIRYKEAIYQFLDEHSNVDVLILKENLPGASDLHIGQVIKDVVETFPRIRIVFIMTSTNVETVQQLKTYLYAKHIYDILVDDEFGGDDLTKALLNPRTAEVAMNENRQLSYEDEMANLRSMENPFKDDNQKNAAAQDIKINYNNGVKYNYPTPQVIAFWSPKSGTGVDTMATFAALMLARYTEVDVCLVDFAEMPNMHLYFNVNDKNRNLEVIYAQCASEKLNPYTLEKFVINGTEIEGLRSSTRLTNLHIVPGATIMMNFFKKIEGRNDREFVGEAFERIINILREKFTIVILNLSSSVHHIPTLASLRKCHSINMVIENDIGCFHNANKYLDEEHGIFNRFDIDRAKVKTVLNKAYVKDDFYLKKFLEMNGLRLDAQVGLMPEELYMAVKNADLTSIFENPDVKNDFLDLVNTITPMEFVEAQKDGSQGKGLFSFLKKSKK